MATRVFVNYRRDDARDMAARVRDRLASTFGRANVFMDVDNLMAGQRFDRELEKALTQTDVLLAVIGPHWLELLGDRQRQGERDYVREEISGALKRGVTVIPVLVDRTPLPRPEDLPDDVRDLVFHQKHVVTHEQFGRDLTALIDAIRFSRRKPRQLNRNLAFGGTFALLAAVIATALYLAGPAAIEAITKQSDTPKADVASNSPAAPPRVSPAVETRPTPPEPARAAPKTEEPSAPAKPAVPAAAKAFTLDREYRLRLASSFRKDGGTEEAFAREVLSASAAKLRIETFAAGMLVPPAAVLEAVKIGAVDLGWTFASTYVGADPTFAVVGGSVPVGVDAKRFADWLRGPGKSLREQFFAAHGVKALGCAFFGPKSLLLRRPIATVEDVRGLKLRGLGLPAQALGRIGAATVMLPFGEIAPALERGVIDGAELLTPAEDERLGLAKVAKHYYYYPLGEPTFSNVVELLVNKSRWDGLEPEARQLLEDACDRHLTAGLPKIEEGAQQALQKLAKSGMSIARLPEPVNAAYMQAVRKVVDEAIKTPTGRAIWQSLSSAR